MGIAAIGYLMAMTYLYTSHEGHDGRPGVSIQDIVDTYYGNRSGTRLEAAIRGPMSGFIEIDDRHEVMAWLNDGAGETEYAAKIEPILTKACIVCHSSASGLQVPDLSSYDGLREFAAVDMGESLHTLMKLSHIHLFGIGVLLLALGLIFRLAEMRRWLKISIIVVPFAAMLADILAWFLTKWDPAYAYVVVSAGAVLGLSMMAQIIISLYQLWLLRPPTGVAGDGQ
ncbi:MAG: hypothetical protein ACE5OQ_01645 [Woeseia sp.]